MVQHLPGKCKLLKKKKKPRLDMAMHACNPRIWKAEAGEFVVQGQLALHSKTVSKQQQQRTKPIFCKTTGSLILVTSLLPVHWAFLCLAWPSSSTLGLYTSVSLFLECPSFFFIFPSFLPPSLPSLFLSFFLVLVIKQGVPIHWVLSLALFIFYFEIGYH